MDPRVGELVQLFHAAEKSYRSILNGKNVSASKNNLKRHTTRSRTLANQMRTAGARKIANQIAAWNKNTSVVRKGRFIVF